MRILHLINHCGKANGHVNVSVDLACTQVKMGHVVGYGCAGGDYTELLKEHGVNTYFITEPHHSLVGFVKANWHLNKIIRLFRPDIIHVHMAAQSVLVQPYRLCGYKVVTTLHNEFDRSARLMSLASRVVAVGQNGYNLLRRWRVPQNKIKIVQNGTIGTPRFSLGYNPIELKHPAVLTICGMHPRKGVADLLDAFAAVKRTIPGVSLYLVGEGPMLIEYKEKAEGLGLKESVHFPGFQADPRCYLASADLFVLASHSDPGPLVIAEARSAGIPIIATNVDGIPAMLDNGNAGILVPPRAPEALSIQMERMLKDAGLRREYAEKSKSGAGYFRLERVCGDLEKIYLELLS